MNRAYAKFLNLQQRKRNPLSEDRRTDFAKARDEDRKLTKGRVFFQSTRIIGSGSDRQIKSYTYVKPKAEGEIKGKLARRAAKKARHQKNQEVN